MHILLIHQYFLEDDQGGGSRWNELSRIWKEAGHQVTVLAGNAHYMQETEPGGRRPYIQAGINKDGVRVVRCHVSGNRPQGFYARLTRYFSFTTSSLLGGVFYTRDCYDVMIATSPPLHAGLAGWLLSYWKSIPLVFEVRDLWPESAIAMEMLRSPLLIRLSCRLEKYIYKKARLIIVLTPSFRDVLIRRKEVPAGKIRVIPNAADFTVTSAAGKHFDATKFRDESGLSGRLVITYTGAHGPANHLEQVLDAASLLRDTPALFLLIGDGIRKQQLRQEACRRQLLNVRFVDIQSKKETLQYIMASDLCLSVLKKSDIFKTVYSNKTFDYFSCRKPVLMAIDGASRKLIKASGAGVFVEPENPDDLAAKIRAYLKAPEIIPRQGQKGYDYAFRHFHRHRLAWRYLKAIQQVVRDRTGTTSLQI